MCVYIYTHTYIHTYLRTYVRTYIHTYRMFVDICTYVYMHIHIRRDLSRRMIDSRFGGAGQALEPPVSPCLPMLMPIPRFRRNLHAVRVVQTRASEYIARSIQTAPTCLFLASRLCATRVRVRVRFLPACRASRFLSSTLLPFSFLGSPYHNRIVGKRVP